MNLVKYLSERKVVTVCLAFILLYTVCLPLVYWLAPSWPVEFDLEAFHKSIAPKCERLLCLSEWINEHQAEADLSQIDESCPSNISGSIADADGSMIFQMFQERKVDWEFLQDIHHFMWYQYCHRSCGIKGAFDFFRYYRAYFLQIAKAWKLHEMCYAPMKTEESCRWRGYTIIFPTYFSYVSIPLTVILNYFNLIILRKLLAKGVATAFYFHAAEVVTDALLNIIIGLTRGIFLTIAIDSWRASCGVHEYSSVYQFFSVTQRFVSFLNQVYLMALLADRLFAMAKPYEYNKLSMADSKKRAKSIVLKILLGSFTFYLPLFFLRTYQRVFFSWMKVSEFWKAYFLKIDLIISGLYAGIGFATVIIQIVCGIIVAKKYRKFINQKMEMRKKGVIKKNPAELKKMETDKQLLLVGTIGLNAITCMISATFSIIVNKSFFELVGISSHPWWAMFLFMMDPVLSFVNGTGGLVIHVIFLKSYRQAFKDTRFGKLIFGNQVHVV